MKFIPILFSSPMVQAILEDRKTMTRRIADVPVGDYNGIDIMDWGLSQHPYFDENDKLWRYRVQTRVDESEGYVLKSQYGQPGDMLWVKETFTVLEYNDLRLVVVQYEDGIKKVCRLTPDEYAKFCKWQKKIGRKSSLFMFKSMSRIFLEVTDVRVERLQDITEEDAIAEGVESFEVNLATYPGERIEQGYDSDIATLYKDYQPIAPFAFDRAKQSFESLWKSINGPDSWQRNEWVRVISFKRIDKPEKFH